MIGSLFRNPNPDFSELERVLKGEKEPQRVHLVECLIDSEVLQVIAERFLDERWISWRSTWDEWKTETPPESYFKQQVMLHYRLGYDYIRVKPIWINHPPPRRLRAEDSAELSRGKREWVDERGGLISSWQQFEQFPWDEIRPDHTPLELVARNLPDGMKMTVGGECLFEHVLENLLGYEGLCFMLHDDPDLVAQIFARWGKKIYDFYESVVGMEEVGAIFHADDLGFKTSTLVSPKILRQLVFPWFKKYAELAHKCGKTFWYHCCGNIYDSGVIEDLIEDVRIDALHSFQDVILPVTDFKARYGNRLAALGGVDVDSLVRLDDKSLREYIRKILARCMPGGRFALGSGNSIANYVPLESFLIMLEESRHYC